MLVPVCKGVQSKVCVIYAHNSCRHLFMVCMYNGQDVLESKCVLDFM